ncbi:MAG: toxin-antitoxin system HicB family antitoxin [Deltaproteobacteria bacterium]|nr:toxin-antitoxin system HicB family antitoxin [Deltaproteobacteria bacterium]
MAKIASSLPYNPEKYTYRVRWSEEDQEHVGLVAEFPSLSWLAKSQGEALDGITKLVGEVLEDMVASKETPPAPLSLQDFSGKILVRVPPEQHRELAMEAAEQGVSMNRLISKKLGG